MWEGADDELGLSDFRGCLNLRVISHSDLIDLRRIGRRQVCGPVITSGNRSGP